MSQVYVHEGIKNKNHVIQVLTIRCTKTVWCGVSMETENTQKGEEKVWYGKSY